MSKRFKDLRPGDYIFIIEPRPDGCPRLSEVVVNYFPVYRDKINVYFSVTKGNEILDIPFVPAEGSFGDCKIFSVSTNREKAVSYHKRALKKLLDASSKAIIREMSFSQNILDELRRTEKINQRKE